jgi:glycosyltransferase involved in cell wall biosynthesis
MSGAKGLRPKVTIAIPTYNRARTFLPTTLGSACAQTFRDLEILVSDNASADDTQAVVSSFNDARIRYHRHPENVGSSKNMDFCVANARGEYLVVVPDDDFLDEDFVATCMDLASRNPGVGVIRTGTRLVDAEGRLIRDAPGVALERDFSALIHAWIDAQVTLYQCATMFRTDDLQRVGLKSRHFLFDDVVALFKVAAKDGCVSAPAVKTSFRLHAGELTFNTNIRLWCEESMDLLDLLCTLSPADARYVRTRGLQFLARGNYHRALRRPFPSRWLACLTVFRTHGYTPPPRDMLVGALKEQLRGLRKAVRRGGRSIG